MRRGGDGAQARERPHLPARTDPGGDPGGHSSAASPRPSHGRAVLACAQEAARRAVAVGAHREAASQYAQALRWAQDLPLEAQAELRERLAYEYFLTARFQDAVDTHER